MLILYFACNTFLSPACLVQPLAEPQHCSVLRPLHTLLLTLEIRVSTRRKAMRQRREILIIVRQTQLRNDLVTEGLQFPRKLRVVFRSHDLHRDSNLSDFLLLQERGMCSGDAVHEPNPLRSKTKNCPASKAKPKGTDRRTCQSLSLHIGTAGRPGTTSYLWPI